MNSIGTLGHRIPIGGAEQAGLNIIQNISVFNCCPCCVCFGNFKKNRWRQQAITNEFLKKSLDFFLVTIAVHIVSNIETHSIDYAPREIEKFLFCQPFCLYPVLDLE